jgi:ABC-type cobalamin/Fe3+-siderophores transport system ATPase subunit
MALEEVFKTGLAMNEFNELYHTAIEVNVWDGQLVSKRFQKTKGAPEKDLMVEGSGFLQWVSVYALALSKDLDVLLLDEPDAHLHPALQGHLIHKLRQLARQNRKQVLLATHSTTILSEICLEEIFRMEDRAYLKDEKDRVRLFVGLGSQYAPRLDPLKRSRRLFLHDGISDLEILQAWARILGLAWPENLVCWKYTKDRTAREILFAELRAEIAGLRAISLQDRDDYPFNDTAADLTFDHLPLDQGGLRLRRWRRRNIENYLLHPTAIARASGRNEPDVRALLLDPHGLNIPADFTRSDCAQTLANTDGKEILTKHARSVTSEFGVTYKQIAEAMLVDEIPDDAKTLLNQIVDLCT